MQFDNFYPTKFEKFQNISESFSYFGASLKMRFDVCFFNFENFEKTVVFVLMFEFLWIYKNELNIDFFKPHV